MVEASIEELRREFDWFHSNYSSVRSKVLIFLGAEFAFLSYFFGTNGFMIFPKELYGIILFFVGLIACIIALSLLLIAIQTVHWELPPESKVYRDLKFDRYIDYLLYTKNRYIESIAVNSAYCEHKHMLLNTAFIFLLLGVTLLMIIKNFS